MKFKAVFILFNAVVVLSFLFIFLMPLIFLGPEYTQLFWGDNWYLGLVFLAILAVLNGYFAANWKLFGLLEREDWPALTAYLEGRIFEAEKFRAQEVRLLIHSYVAVNKPMEIRRLDTFLREKRPQLADRYALSLGVPYLLSNDGGEIETYFERARNQAPRGLQGWANWAYAFGLMLQQKTADAKPVLRSTVENARDPLLELVTLYLLDAYREADDEIAAFLTERIEALRSGYSREKISRLLERRRGELHILVVSQLIDSATDWCFKEE
ncbi:MAG: hypothetical protein ACOC45_06200 [Alkalispirochaetaceae bacterium]